MLVASRQSRPNENRLNGQEVEGRALLSGEVSKLGVELRSVLPDHVGDTFVQVGPCIVEAGQHLRDHAGWETCVEENPDAAHGLDIGCGELAVPPEGPLRVE
jgi:hypothetical protein